MSVAPLTLRILKCRSLGSARDDGYAVTFGRAVIVCEDGLFGTDESVP